MNHLQAKESPSVDVLLSIYRPRMDWFISLLDSINAQTYKNATLIVANDNPADDSSYEPLIRRHVHRYKVIYYKNPKNLGTTASFENLTRKSSSSYIAYCDQDDIWLPEKLETLVQVAEKSSADLVCSDMFVIDEEGKRICDSITKLRRKQKLCVTPLLKRQILISNFVYGCAMLIRQSTALRALPIPCVFYHDWWMALDVVLKGRLVVVNKPLLEYRIAGQNQTGFFSGIQSKGDYRDKVVLDRLKKLLAVKERFPCCGVDKELDFYIEYFSNLYDLFLSVNLKKFATLLRKSFSGNFDYPWRQSADCVIAIAPESLCKFGFLSIKVYKAIHKMIVGYRFNKSRGGK